MLKVFDFLLKIVNLSLLSRCEFILLRVEHIVFHLSIIGFSGAEFFKQQVLVLPLVDIAVESVDFLGKIVSDVLLFLDLVRDFILLGTDDVLQFSDFLIESINLILMVELESLDIRSMLVVQLISD